MNQSNNHENKKNQEPDDLVGEVLNQDFDYVRQRKVFWKNFEKSYLKPEKKIFSKNAGLMSKILNIPNVFSYKYFGLTIIIFMFFFLVSPFASASVDFSLDFGFNNNQNNQDLVFEEENTSEELHKLNNNLNTNKTNPTEEIEQDDQVINEELAFEIDLQENCNLSLADVSPEDENTNQNTDQNQTEKSDEFKNQQDIFCETEKAEIVLKIEDECKILFEKYNQQEDFNLEKIEFETLKNCIDKEKTDPLVLDYLGL